MFDWPVYLHGLMGMGIFAVAGWLVSVARKNVTLVDSMWSLFFLLATLIYLQSVPQVSDRATLLAALVGIWALRLSAYLTWRNRLFAKGAAHEDHRYQAIRKNNEPHFWFKSLYIIFALQALLAWIISLPLLGAVTSVRALNWLDAAGFALWLLGFLWEATGDYQLSRFKANPANKDAVMDKGLWRYSRHPNYFGECCLWWGYYLIALAAGAWWSLPAPLLMTLLLLKISGVSLLEKDIGERRPGYNDYIVRTNALIPGPTKR